MEVENIAKPKPRLDLMLDIETLSTSNDTTLIQLACVAFDIRNGNTISEFNEFIDIEKTKDLKVSGSTIKWWLKTNVELFKELIQKGNLSEKDVFEKFYSWIKELQETYAICIWGNGINFDVQTIKTKLAQYEISYPISFKNERDVRTIVDLYCAKKGISEKQFKDSFNSNDLVAHNGLDDCKYQIKYVVHAYNDLINDKMEE